MYSYSPIKTMKVKNFRNIGEVTIDFTESPIVTLVGENESGKTSIVKAFGVCAMHADPRSQKDYIRDGTSGFGVAIELEDGTQIVRIKQSNANRYMVKHTDGTTWDANKLENEVPKAVQEVMGLIEEPETKEFLHIRTYEDQLLFVVTPASTNYKVMYDALKISQITKAIKAGSTEANTLKSDISQAETSIDTLRKSLSSIRTYDIEPLLNIRNKLTDDLAIISKMEAIVNLKNDLEHKKNQLGSIALLDEHGVSDINTLEVSILDSIGRVLDGISDNKRKLELYSSLDSAESIDVGVISRIEAIFDNKNQLKKLMDNSSIYRELSSIEPISQVEISLISSIESTMQSLASYNKLVQIYNLGESQAIPEGEFYMIDKMNRVINYRFDIEDKKQKLSYCEAWETSILDWMKQVGVYTKSCPKCGEDIVIDLDLLNNGG